MFYDTYVEALHQHLDIYVYMYVCAANKKFRNIKWGSVMYVCTEVQVTCTQLPISPY